MNKLVEFIIPSIGDVKLLRVILSSLAVQTIDDWSAHIVIDNMIDNKIIDLIEDFNTLHNLKLTFTGKKHGDWGHTPREIGKQASNANYIIMTGDDNYYTPNIVEELKKASQGNPAMIYWDMVHNSYGYSYFKCFPAFNQIDMGAFATRNDLAKQIKLGNSYAADGTYVDDFKKLFPYEQIKRIDKVMFVHN